MGHVAKHSAGAGSNRDRSAPPSEPGEPAETPAEPVAVKPGEPGDRPDDPAGSVVVEPMDPPAPMRSRTDAERTVVRPTMPARGARRWWQFGRPADEPRPVSHAAGAKPRPTPDENRPRTADRDPAPGVSTGRARVFGGPEASRDRSGPGSTEPGRFGGPEASRDRSALDSTEGARESRSPDRFGFDSPGGARAGSLGSASGLSAWGALGSRENAALEVGDRSPITDTAPWPGPDSSTGAESDDSDDDGGSVKLREGERSALRPTAPTGTPTYEGESAGVEDTAILPKLGSPLQTQRIWTSRPDPAEEDADGKGKKKKSKKIDVTSLLDVGIKLLPEMEPSAPDGPITNARWAALVRAAARRMIWSLPVAGVVAGAASIGAMVRGGPAHYLSGAEPFRLIAWVTSVWLGMLAMICLVGLLAAVRVRGTALLGLMLGLLGGISMLMFAAVPPATPIWGLSAKTLTLSCGALYSAGWMAMGWAVFRSRMFTRGDGLMLVLCGPMVGIAGLWMSPFHTAGALLMVAAGLGIAWKSGSTLRAVRAGREADLAERTGPPLELAEIRPRRARKEKKPKTTKRSARAAKRAEAAKQAADAKQAEARKAADAKQAKERSDRGKQPDAASRQSGQAGHSDHGKQQPDAARNQSGYASPKSDSARQSEWSRQGSQHAQSDDRSRRDGREPDQARGSARAGADRPQGTANPAKDDKAPRGPGKRRLRVGATTDTPAPPPKPEGNRRKRWGFKRDGKD
ncbi:hypothetical protein Ais01nite_57680 [Asanoa ishikariensis]|uniref:Uncharacterized protein n=1 Tax=Asanoa ishikariensis TaxID=137265 RepID=A0A1H3U077_9ACTN|nr:hypothetical protein [Asanoa ishikariensis]GIF67733.1 hypothetical protein Ais01nite_57680 [Asanoa ishikariensis]SDZ55451.1 hypothetical protein SAMN05421684_6630 [Asanoa ishikariensis]